MEFQRYFTWEELAKLLEEKKIKKSKKWIEEEKDKEFRFKLVKRLSSDDLKIRKELLKFLLFSWNENVCYSPKKGTYSIGILIDEVQEWREKIKKKYSKDIARKVLTPLEFKRVKKAVWGADDTEE